MPSFTQIIYSKVSDAYKSGLVNLNGTLTQISKADGLKRSYLGYQTEDDSILFWVNDWVSKDARDAMAKNADYDAARAACSPAFSSDQATINVVEFEDTKGALGAPITEFVTFTLKEGQSIDQLEPLVQELHKKLAGTPKFHGDSWAPIIGKPNVYHGILGWDTVEAHWDAVKDGPLKEVIDRVKQIADLWLVHAALKPFSA